MGECDHCHRRAEKIISGANNDFCSRWFRGYYCYWCWVRMTIEFESISNKNTIEKYTVWDKDGRPWTGRRFRKAVIFSCRTAK